MLGLGNSNQANGVKKPIFEIDFGSAPVDKWESSLVSLTVESGLAPFADVAEIIITNNAAAPGIAVGDTGSISLGYNDSPETVFTGRIDSIEHNIHGFTKISAINGGALLSCLRVNQSYEKQNAGEIVSDLAGNGEVETDIIEDGIAYPFFVIDDGKNIYQHIYHLAGNSNYICFINHEGALNFTSYTGGNLSAEFTYGVNLISLEITEQTPFFESVAIVGEGAASSQGEEAWCWLVKNPSSVTQGDPAGAARLISDPSLRSKDAVMLAADGVTGAAITAWQIKGNLLAAGEPLALVGNPIQINDTPDDFLNGECMVRYLKHTFNKQSGFMTGLEFFKTV